MTRLWADHGLPGRVVVTICVRAVIGRLLTMMLATNRLGRCVNLVTHVCWQTRVQSYSLEHIWA